MKRFGIACLFALSTVAVAQPPQAPPMPPEVQKTVALLAGTWSYQLKLTPPGAATIVFPGT